MAREEAGGVRADGARPATGAATARSAGDPARWTAEHVAAIAAQDVGAPRLITADDVRKVAAHVDVWDAWPLQRADGDPADVGDGETLWMALAAPHFADPDERHAHARIHLISRRAGSWRDLGPAMPDGFSPGSREWSGSAVLEHDDRSVTLYFTATGRRGEEALSFEQRLFRAGATLERGGESGGDWRLTGWHGLAEIVVRDPAHYMASDSGSGRVGTIKAFRDPAYFRDPADGASWLFFAGSQAGSASSYNGVIGAAVQDPASDGSWRITPPIVTADGVNNELERPHVVAHGGRCYLFWSTQSHVFDPDGPVGPTGLYGMVAPAPSGPWAPLNGTGLVFANPASAPRQAYSWLVMPDLQVTSFIDDWEGGEDAAGVARPRRFGATFAPMVQLSLDGDRAVVAG